MFKKCINASKKYVVEGLWPSTCLPLSCNDFQRLFITRMTKRFPTNWSLRIIENLRKRQNNPLLNWTYSFPKFLWQKKNWILRTFAEGCECLFYGSPYNGFLPMDSAMQQKKSKLQAIQIFQSVMVTVTMVAISLYQLNFGAPHWVGKAQCLYSTAESHVCYQTLPFFCLLSLTCCFSSNFLNR